MQALYNLVQSLAKEEKRLYNLHGRKGRFIKIYEGYLQANEYDKNLDRQIYQKHYSSFSKAFYSMQKNALLDDILAVLLEYSNSSRNDFMLSKFRAKYEVLNHKKFHDQALQYIRSALDIAEKHSSDREYLRVLEDYRDTLVQSESVTWEEYSEVLEKISSTGLELGKTQEIEEEHKKFKVLLKSAQKKPDEMELYRNLSLEILERLQQISEANDQASGEADLFLSEYQYSKTFEDKFELHRRLVKLEKKCSAGQYPMDVQLKLTNLLMESSMDCGDFLLINGIIYKTKKVLSRLTPDQKKNFLPRFLELCGIYHFYENDLPLSQQEIGELLEIEGLEKDRLVRNYYHLVAVLIAANLPKTAAERLDELVRRFPEQKNEIASKLMELVITVEMNKRDDATVMLQRLLSFIRKSPNSRKLSHIRNFLEMVQKMMARKSFRYQEITALKTEWNELLKPNLWLKAKVENNFYYNCILDYWQEKKQILNV